MVKTEAATRGVLIKDVLRNFAKFTGKHLCQSLNFIKKETLAQVFSSEFCEISKNTFFTEHLRTTASVKNTFVAEVTFNNSIEIYQFVFR